MLKSLLATAILDDCCFHVTSKFADVKIAPVAMRPLLQGVPLLGATGSNLQTTLIDREVRLNGGGNRYHCSGCIELDDQNAKTPLCPR